MANTDIVEVRQDLSGRVRVAGFTLNDRLLMSEILIKPYAIDSK